MRLVAMIFVVTFGKLDRDNGLAKSTGFFWNFPFYQFPSRETKALICPKQIFQMVRGSRKTRMSQMIGMFPK